MRHALKAVLVLWLTSCAIVAWAQTETWPMFRKDPPRTAVSASDLLAPPFTQCWRVAGRYFGSPVVAAGRVFAVGRSGKLIAVDAATGRLLWAQRVRGAHVATPAVTQDIVFFGVADGIRGALEARRTDSGELLWRFETTHQVNSSPVVAGDIVIFGGRDRFVYALDAKTGKPRWKYETGLSICSSPTVADGNVYIGSGDSYLYALDLADGTLRWRLKTGGRVDSSPASAAGKVFVGSFDGCVYAADAESGRQVWKTCLSDAWVHSSPLYLDGAIYVGSLDGALYCLDAEDGDIRWRQPTGGSIYASPVGLGGLIYCGSRDHRLYAFDPAAGEIVWRARLGGYVHTTPATDGLGLYVGSWRGLFGFTTANQRVIGAHPEIAFPLARGPAAMLILNAFHHLLPTPAGPAAVRPFADEAPGDPYCEAVAAAARVGLIEGYPSGEFHSTCAVNWHEFVVMCSRALDLAGIFPPPKPVDFVDSNHWAARRWAAMAGAGVLPEQADPGGAVAVAEGKRMIEALVAWKPAPAGP